MQSDKYSHEGAPSGEQTGEVAKSLDPSEYNGTPGQRYLECLWSATAHADDLKLRLAEWISRPEDEELREAHVIAHATLDVSLDDLKEAADKFEENKSVNEALKRAITTAYKKFDRARESLHADRSEQLGATIESIYGGYRSGLCGEIACHKQQQEESGFKSRSDVETHYSALIAESNRKLELFKNEIWRFEETAPPDSLKDCYTGITSLVCQLQTLEADLASTSVSQEGSPSQADTQRRYSTRSSGHPSAAPEQTAGADRAPRPLRWMRRQGSRVTISDDAPQMHEFLGLTRA